MSGCANPPPTRKVEEKCQAISGEFDGYIEPYGRWVLGPNWYEAYDRFFNYTHFQYIYDD